MTGLPRTGRRCVMTVRRSGPIVRPLLAAILIGALVATALSCAGGHPPADTKEALEEALDQAFDESGAPGAIAGTRTPEYEWTVARGSSDVEAGREIEETDKHSIGSITKTFTATIVLQLVDEGKVGLDEPASKYVSLPEQFSEVTVRQLMQHTSGISNWNEIEELARPVLENPSKWTYQELLELSLEQPPYFEPGSAFHYSNADYWLLGMMIEEVTGNEYDSELEGRILEPLGLEGTSMPEGPPGSAKDFVHWYATNEDGKLVDMTGDPITDAVNWRLPWAAGAMVSTLDDLLVWAEAYGTGRLISGEAHAEQMKMVPEGEKGRMYGLGMESRGDWTGHNGAVVGGDCDMFYYPDTGAAVVTFWNKLSPFNPDASEAEDAYPEFFSTVANILYPGSITSE